MPKYILFPKHVMNLGGYIIENQANLGYRDVIVGNPTKESIKLYVPIYGEDDVVAIEKLGVLIHRFYEDENLVEEIQEMKRRVEEKPI